MGWRSVKEFFNIDYIVHINTDGNLCVGTLTIPELIVASRSGKLLKRYNSNQQALIKIQDDFERQRLKLASLVRKKECSERGTPIFYFDNNGIHADTYTRDLKPIVTTSGRLLIDNFFFSKEEAIDEAIKATKTRNKQLQETLVNVNLELKANQNLLDTLLAST